MKKKEKRLDQYLASRGSLLDQAGHRLLVLYVDDERDSPPSLNFQFIARLTSTLEMKTSLTRAYPAATLEKL